MLKLLSECYYVICAYTHTYIDMDYPKKFRLKYTFGFKVWGCFHLALYVSKFLFWLFLCDFIFILVFLSIFVNNLTIYNLFLPTTMKFLHSTSF